MLNSTYMLKIVQIELADGFDMDKRIGKASIIYFGN